MQHETHSSQEHRPETQNVHCITLRMGHHAGPSGYDRLAAAMGANVINTTRPEDLFHRVIAKLLRGAATRSQVHWYHRENLLAEIEAASVWLKRRNQLFHFLYGENSYRYLANMKKIANRNHRVVATFHTPQDRFREIVKKTDHIRKLDAAFIVSTTQRSMFEGLLEPHQIFYTPHGIDTDYFHPAEKKPRLDRTDTLDLLMVGSHLRNFELAEKLVKHCAGYRPEVHFHFVTRPDLVSGLQHMPNVSVYSQISDTQLRQRYQLADALFMPLRDCTANNALLEGMACGLPVIATDLPGVRDYVDESASILLPNELESWICAISEMCEGGTPLGLLGAASRNCALKFSWDNVVRSMLVHYNGITAF